MSKSKRRKNRGGPQGRFWILTIPAHAFVPYLPPGIIAIEGQLERGKEGGEDGYLHWQIIICCEVKRRPAFLKGTFGDFHHELTRSDAARAYCHKEETRVVGTEFLLGKWPFRRSSKVDWDMVKLAAQQWDFNSIPSSIYVRCYRR